ncbi:hypothetical protein [Marinifilum caeruleilacunae]|uniref:NodB homology domain-containing protein n=1 Tax=Marinifilum caeruleilacunae TaxID=2499076 RepID=A0ABX1WTM7_9BACT|nr:hypothetical protein [Marinifilum caeruleilacunae]NOU59285.1 hypothetical protein [Marinifilum caeruleilacunae]
MKPLNLCLSIDYELFGSGRGDVFTHIIEPTNRMLAICCKNGIKLSIFFEIVEYWKLKENYESGERMGYDKNPAEAMAKQIRKAHQMGHDVQLHLHPQWIDAKYENGEWKLNMKYWRLPEVPDRANDEISMGLGELIRKAKEDLEAILKPVNPDYTCNVLRAGAYNIDPSERLLKVLKENGFIADTSVYYGGKADNNLSRYDYTNIKNDVPYWFTNGSLLSASNNHMEFLELPVFAKQIRRIRKYDLIRVRSALKNKANSIEKFKNNSVKKSKWETFKYLLDKESITWDFCLFSKSKMRKFLKAAYQANKSSNVSFHPFVLVGHPKDFYYPDAIDYLARKASAGKLKFFTISEVISQIKKTHTQK